jgi:hypothetical protein
MLTFLAFNIQASLTPIVAVRNVINKFLSERDLQLSKSSSNRSRGSRLENKVGLNITDDEYVILKLKESEQKKIRSRKPRLPKDKTIPSSTNRTKTTKCRKTSATSKKANKENETYKDPLIASAVQRLENVIQLTQTTFDNDSSDEEF